MPLTYALGNKSDRTPQIAYSLSSDFDYRRYLEEKSHFDEVSFQIDESTRRLLGSQGEIRQAISDAAYSTIGQLRGISHAVESVRAVIDERLTDIEAGIGRVEAEIVSLRDVTELGFASVAQGLYDVNTLLDEIVNTLQRPEQTWANEQFKNARECMRKNLREEALEFVTLAIEGDSNNRGHKIDPAFHFLRGIVLLGDSTEDGMEVLDAKEAQVSFRRAIRYCADTNDRLKAEALTHLAWAQMIDSDGEDPLGSLLQAIACNASHALAHFLAAKAFISRDEIDKAEEYFLQAIRLNPRLSARALIDADFTRHEVRVEEWIKICRNEIETALIDFLKREGRLEKNQKLVDLAEAYGVQDMTRSTMACRIWRTASAAGILDLHNWNGIRSQILNELARGRAAMYDRIHQVLKKRAPRHAKPRTFFSPWLGLVGGVPMFFWGYNGILALFGRVESSSSDELGAFIAGMITGGIGFAISAGAAFLIAAFFEDREHAAVEARNAKADSAHADIVKKVRETYLDVVGDMAASSR